jgi:hypothetical protein
MPRQVKASLPARAVPVMEWLVGLSEQEFRALVDKAISGGPVRSRTELADRLKDALPDTPPSRGSELVTEIFSLINLHSTHGWPIEEIAAVAASSKSLSLGDEQQEMLQGRLVELVSDPVIMGLARAFDFQGEHQYLLHFARIVSDIRPIPDDSGDGAVIGAIITHTLKLDYHSIRGREEIYLSLDDTDLEDLGEAVERAKRESKSLEELIRAAGLTDFSRSAE